ncbi:MAG: hypothetical protein LC742_08685 [Acidobacteria bacterium]|nr:hypothetical protein [Acidobacteriota bacterium]
MILVGVAWTAQRQSAPKFDYAAIIASSANSATICYFEQTGLRLVEVRGKITDAGLTVAGDALATSIYRLGDESYEMVGSSPVLGGKNFPVGLNRDLDAIYFKKIRQ